MENEFPELENALSVFMSHFGPAANKSEADEMLTSSEIAEYLSELISIPETANTVIYEILRDNGYKYDFSDRFVWLLKIKR